MKTPWRASFLKNVVLQLFSIKLWLLGINSLSSSAWAEPGTSGLYIKKLSDYWEIRWDDCSGLKCCVPDTCCLCWVITASASTRLPHQPAILTAISAVQTCTQASQPTPRDVRASISLWVGSQSAWFSSQPGSVHGFLIRKFCICLYYVYVCYIFWFSSSCLPKWWGNKWVLYWKSRPRLVPSSWNGNFWKVWCLNFTFLL